MNEERYEDVEEQFANHVMKEDKRENNPPEEKQKVFVIKIILLNFIIVFQ